MLDFKHTICTRKYHNNLDIAVTPVMSWNFHREYLDEVENYEDCNKLSVIANNKWTENDWDFKNMLKRK
jgi:hypothetical protein